MHDIATMTPSERFSSRMSLEAAVAAGQDDAETRYRLWELLLVEGKAAAAMENLHSAIRMCPIRRSQTWEEHSKRRNILVLAAPGDFQTNLPLAMLLEPLVSVHVYWLSPGEEALDDRALRVVGPIDCLFIAIAEDRRLIPILQQADRLASRSGLPVINSGAAISRLSRTGVLGVLAGIEGVLLPDCREVRASDVLADDMQFPVLLRPIDSHAGRDLMKVDSKMALSDHLARSGGEGAFYLTTFIDYKNVDGLYRKYRVVFVAGKPFPVHMAIHHDWGVWYYNAGMDRAAEKREEERKFLTDPASVIGADAFAALCRVGEAVGLDYFGIDFAITRDGDVLLFEVETGMIVHDHDAPEVFPYKHAAFVAVRDAMITLIEQRIVDFAQT